MSKIKYEIIFEERTIFIGDAAHSFHPLAGQGWNLGIKDVESLYSISKNYKKLGIELGNSSFCKKYHNDSYYKAYRLYQLTDKLDSIFQINNLELKKELRFIAIEKSNNKDTFGTVIQLFENELK